MATCASKTLAQIATRDDLWEPHLKFLLAELYDDSCHPQNQNHTLVPFTKTVNWKQSTAFRKYFVKKDNNAVVKLTVGYVLLLEDDLLYYETMKNRSRKIPENMEWLLVNVPAKKYYEQAGAMALDGIFMHNSDL